VGKNLSPNDLLPGIAQTCPPICIRPDQSCASDLTSTIRGHDRQRTTVCCRPRLRENACAVLKSALLRKICQRLFASAGRKLCRSAIFVPVLTVKPAPKRFHTAWAKSGPPNSQRACGLGNSTYPSVRVVLANSAPDQQRWRPTTRLCLGVGIIHLCCVTRHFARWENGNLL